jgi:hypothetical protein
MLRMLVLWREYIDPRKSINHGAPSLQARAAERAITRLSRFDRFSKSACVLLDAVIMYTSY